MHDRSLFQPSLPTVRSRPAKRQLNFISLILTAIVLTAFAPSLALAQDRVRCNAFDADPKSERIRAVEPPTRKKDFRDYLTKLQARGRLVYRGAHVFRPATAFIASNEHHTVGPLLGRAPVDLMVAFGTNSSWEIAVDGNARNLVIADWTPLPILTHAFLIEPLLRISGSSVEFLQLINAQVPRFSGFEIDANLPAGKELESSRYLSFEQVKTFLDYLKGRPEISVDELEFISGYFYARTSEKRYRSLSLFDAFPNSWYINLMYYMTIRYSELTPSQQRLSVLHNPYRFSQLKELYARDDGVAYALMDFRDMDGFRAIRNRYGTTRRWTVSASNVFDMTYAPITDLKKLLTGLTKIAGGAPMSPLVLFMTKLEWDSIYVYQSSMRAELAADSQTNELGEQTIAKTPFEARLIK